MSALPRLFLLILASLCLWPDGTAEAAEVSGLASPPAHYLRRIEIEVRDVSGRPLPKVRARIISKQGRLWESGELVSGEAGLISFQLEPLITEPMADIKIRDRFLQYRSVFEYRLFKAGYIPQAGLVEDEQEFAAMSDPLFQGLDRRPAREPLTLRIRLPAYRDYLAEADYEETQSESEADRLKPLIDALIEGGRSQGFTLAFGSLGRSPDGVLNLGLEFTPLFDPAELGLVAAGVALLRGVVLACLKAVDRYYPDAEKIDALELRAVARFQSRKRPFAMPVEKIFVFRLPARVLPKLLDWQKGEPFPPKGLEAVVDGRTLDLTAELGPEAQGQGALGRSGEGP